MMEKFRRAIILIYTIWVVLIVSLCLSGKITFGHGLGDLYYLAGLVLLTLLFLTIFLRIRKKVVENPMMTYASLFCIVLIIVIFSLKLTFFRGSEYPWNGAVFL